MEKYNGLNRGYNLCIINAMVKITAECELGNPGPKVLTNASEYIKLLFAFSTQNGRTVLKIYLRI